MKKSIPLALFLFTTAGLMYSGSRTVANANFGTLKAPDTLAGIDVSISAIAASTGGPSASNIGIYTSTSAGRPTNRFVMSATTISCNTRPNNVGQTISGTFYEYPVPEWYAAWDGDLPANDARGARHPYIAINTYRLNAEGRLEQLGAAWVKHGWYAASASQGTVGGANGQPACGTGSCAGPDNTALGANCSDTYGASLNVAADDVGPRSEINPRAAAGITSDPGAIGWTMQGSWHNTMNRDSANTYKDNRVNNTGAANRFYTFTGTTQAWKLNNINVNDIKPAALGATGKFFIEGYYVVNGDKYKFNNVAYRRYNVNGLSATSGASSVSMSTAGGATPTFTNDGPHTFGPAMLDWGDRQAAMLPNTEGTGYVSSRVVKLPAGQGYRYEYAVFNLDIDRELNSIEIPMPTFANPTSFGFAQPRQADPGYHSHVDPLNPPANADTPDANTDWVGAYDMVKGALVFSPPTPPNGYLPNTLRWGRTYTVWFTSPLPPRFTGSVTTAQRRAGTLGPLAAANLGTPKNPADIGDNEGNPNPVVTAGGVQYIDGDGVVNEGDYNCFFNHFFLDAPANLPADIADSTGEVGSDGVVNEGDYNCFFNNFFLI